MQTQIQTSKGFSLVEVMITLMLGVIVLLMLVQVFVNTKESHAQNDRVSETLESGRFAMRQLATDLQNAGFYGGVLDPSLVSVDSSLVSPAVDCGASGETNWAYDLTSYRSVQYDSPGVVANHTCVSSTDLYSGSDILTVKRVFAQAYDPSATPFPLKPYNIYLRSDYNSACLWYYDGSTTGPSGGNCPTTNVDDWLYLTHVYYIRTTNDNGDKVPTLCRKTLDINSSGKPTMDDLCLAQGVEKFHVMFGIDTDSPRDGVANKFVSAPTKDELTTRVVSARVYVLVRALQQDSTFKNDKTYTLGDMTPYTPNDNYYRRLYSTTVVLRNPMYASVFNDY